MKQKTLCFTHGLSRKDIETCAMAFYVMRPPEAHLCVVPITDTLLSRTVGDVIAEQAASSPGLDATNPSANSFRAILIVSDERDVVMDIVKSFKSALPNPGDLIFAAITETAQTWTFAYYLNHLSEEHEYMKTHRPEDDPEMRPM
jgi:hypothetical protein